MQNTDYHTQEYWDERCLEGQQLDDYEGMIFEDHNRQEYWSRNRKALSLWKDRAVLDVCCGYGQFSDIFTRYIGIDFSPEMISLAKKKFPAKHFLVSKASEFKEKCDVIFECNSLHSLGMTPEQFYEQFKDQAKEAIVCLERDAFTIFNIY